MRSTVVLIPIDSYEQARVDAAVLEGIEKLGGLSGLIDPEERVLLKPNLLGRAIPEKAVTTHPAVFSAVCRLLREEGYAHLSYGDSPGNPTTTPSRAAEASGIEEAARRYNVPLADFVSGSVVPFPEGHVSRSFYLCHGVQEADALINLCKMKTHALERITGAVKNLYGCVTGVNKAAGHAAHPNSEAFADMLADLHRCVKPRLHIMDGIVAMEGNGPTSGTPVAMNMLLFSTDPVALDALFAALVHLDPAEVPTCVSGAREGLGTMTLGDIDVVTPRGVFTVPQAVERYGKADFHVFRGRMKKSLVLKLVPLMPFMQHRPRVDRRKCVACGICEEACPVPGKAVHSGHGQKAKYDYHKCIRCYCCQEMCPAKAIEVYRSPIARLLSGK